MRISSKAAAGIVLAAVAIGAQAQSAGIAITAEQGRHLQKGFADVHQWKQPVPGLFEGRRKDGAQVRVYTTATRELYLSELEVQIEELSSVRAPTATVRQQVESEIQRLRAELADHRRIAAADGGQMRASNQQSHYNAMASVCSLIPYASTTFAGGWNHGDTYATFHPLGEGPQFGPMPPLPTQVTRHAMAKVNEVTQFSSQTWYRGAGNQMPLTPMATTVTFPRSCSMEASYSVSAQCSYGGSGFAGIHVLQTCDGLYNGRPPIIRKK